MADHPTHPGAAAAGDESQVDTHAMGEVHEHPTWKTYKWVALWLTVITIAEVWAYYVPRLVNSRLFVPALLIMSAAKFVIVVLFYMHLRYDHRLFKVLFTGPLIIAIATIISLLFLFGHLLMRIGG